MPSENGVRGHLLLRVEEASGKTQNGDHFVWDTSASANFEAFVKVEIRGGVHNVKVQSTKAPLIGENITWRENLKLEVLEGANELRLMLCKHKISSTSGKLSTSVIAACGIFVNDIVDAVPIDKYFELFKPNGGGEGGLIRICMDFAKDAKALERKGHLATISIPEDQALGQNGGSKGHVEGTPKRRPLRLVLSTVLLCTAAGLLVRSLVQRKKQKDK
ncbi:hypothetical protein CEUSTIGMA_g4391.t1 [Chlamydomonas eustigma]|uniref:C2 domain-containing protein n=1 Tax=Chlamydomonas eustigma TaxID=1157962 RepID=A0A250X1G7_9CHLO|nr:hypothetical protein CEUSTIGMA_g4391.t1 [Chlamydomonas eustigma]|eukprot:GAX76944.1 hypothetical protein CEUSTIGMA_g4391.t1 [Chlamydomonas eustigma]